MLGGGEMAESCMGHWSLSDETREWSLLSVLGIGRRARAWILVIEGSERRVERMWEPCHDGLEACTDTSG
jgi:hypothetical protein